MKDRIIEIVAQNLNLDVSKITEGSIQPEFNSTKEWDSLAHLSIMTDLEDEFDVEIDIDQMEQLTNIDQIVAHLENS